MNDASDEWSRLRRACLEILEENWTRDELGGISRQSMAARFRAASRRLMPLARLAHSEETDKLGDHFRARAEAARVLSVTFAALADWLR